MKRKMQFEDFDNKIRQAADQHHPSYDEKAWAKMEKLLDHELPQKEDRRRRFIFLLLLLLLLGGGLWVMIDRPWQKTELTSNTNSNNKDANNSRTGTGNDPGATGSTDNSKVNTAPGNPTTPNTSTTNPAKDDGNPGPGKSKTGTVISPNGNKDDLGISIDQPGTSRANPGTTTPSTKGQVANRGGKDNNLDIQVTTPGIASGKQKNNKTKTAGGDKQDIVSSGGKTRSNAQSKNNQDKNNIADPADNNNTGKTNDKDKATTDKSDKSVSDKTGPPITTVPDLDANPNKPAAVDTDKNDNNKANKPQADSATTNKPATEEKKTAQQNSNKKKSFLFFSVSAGPDISSVGMSSPGKVKLLTGAGVGYTFKERLTIRTGFYSASKVYDAKPADYKPTQPLPNPQDLKDIEADCKVYEIPVTIAYNFGKSPKHRTFVSAGLSSFIMKKEKYVYWYEYIINPSSPPVRWSYTHTEDNKFKHYFSVLSLSAGYQRRINKTFSVAVEPYVKLPLAGVGYGKIKLNSAGILFSLNVIPFQGSRK